MYKRGKRNELGSYLPFKLRNGSVPSLPVLKHLFQQTLDASELGTRSLPPFPDLLDKLVDLLGLQPRDTAVLSVLLADLLELDVRLLELLIKTKYVNKTYT